MVAHSIRHGARSRGAIGGRMLVAVALTGAAALLAGCGTADDAGASQQPTAPPASAGADPVPLDEARLQASGLLEGIGEQAIDVRWIEPGSSIAVVVGGSGSGGECIPQPHAASVAADGAIEVRFDPPNPDVVCTMDFRLHGWELALPAPVDAGGTVPVRLVDTAGAGETIELELGPDDVLDAGSADPQPSIIPGEPVDAAPVAIPPEQLPDVSTAVDATQDPPIAVHWLEPGTELAVLLGGSGTAACVPQPVGATATGPGALEIAFAPLAPQDCSGDLALYGWRLPLPEAVPATLDVQVTVTGLGDEVAITVPPDDVLALG